MFIKLTGQYFAADFTLAVYFGEFPSYCRDLRRDRPFWEG